MFSQIVVPATGGAINCQRSPDSGQTTTSLPISLTNVLYEARQHATNFDDFLLAKRELAARDAVTRPLSDRCQVAAVG
jgi:hypothetical protein